MVYKLYVMKAVVEAKNGTCEILEKLSEMALMRIHPQYIIVYLFPRLLAELMKASKPVSLRVMPCLGDALSKLSLLLSFP